MDRRRFLAALLGGAVLDTDKLLWRPGAKLISIPAPRGFELEELAVLEAFDNAMRLYIAPAARALANSINLAHSISANFDRSYVQVVDWERNEQARVLRCVDRRYNGCG